MNDTKRPIEEIVDEIRELSADRERYREALEKILRCINFFHAEKAVSPFSALQTVEKFVLDAVRPTPPCEPTVSPTPVATPDVGYGYEECQYSPLATEKWDDHNKNWVRFSYSESSLGLVHYCIYRHKIIAPTGYRIVDPEDNISSWDIFYAVKDGIGKWNNMDGGCPFVKAVAAHIVKDVYRRPPRGVLIQCFARKL